jgi:hypothetical protein
MDAMHSPTTLETWMATTEWLTTLTDRALAEVLRDEVLDSLEPGTSPHTLVAAAITHVRGTETAGVPNDALATELVDQVWAALPIMTLASDVVSEVIDRLEEPS